MIQFNIKRFGKLARWSLTSDRRFYVRNFLQMLVVLTLVYLGFTLNILNYGEGGICQNYPVCATITIIILLIDFFVGPSMMFASMKGKHDDQMLMMLPASNFEKYLMRYATWLILLPLILVAILSADVIQYAVNMLMGHEGTRFVTGFIMDRVNEILVGSTKMPRNLLTMIVLTLLSIHSFYALGATFFRSHKFTAIFTTIALIILSIVQTWIFPNLNMHIDSDVPTTGILIWDASLAFGVIVNFLLSYWLFRRTQVIGRFVNL